MRNKPEAAPRHAQHKLIHTPLRLIFPIWGRSPASAPPTPSSNPARLIGTKTNHNRGTENRIESPAMWITAPMMANFHAEPICFQLHCRPCTSLRQIKRLLSDCENDMQ